MAKRRKQDDQFLQPRHRHHEQQAAVRIDCRISGTEAEPSEGRETGKGDTHPPDFEPYKPKRRKSGTDCVTMLNDHLYEGRYTLTNAYGKRKSHNNYAKTREECEEKLATMIAKVKQDWKSSQKLSRIKQRIDATNMNETNLSLYRSEFQSGRYAKHPIGLTYMLNKSSPISFTIFY